MPYASTTLPVPSRAMPRFPIAPLPLGDGGVRARQGQGERLRSLDCHTLI
jgi:hypothetical protein